MKRSRDSGRLWYVVGLVALGTVFGCEKSDPSAEALLREAVGNAYGYSTQGEVKVSFPVAGTTVTPWFRVSQGTGPNGPYQHRRPLHGRPLFGPGGKPPGGQVIRSGRGRLTDGQGALAIDNIVAITDVQTFIAVHRVSVVNNDDARKTVAGRRVVHLSAAPRSEPGLHYDIFVDVEKKFILGVEERDTTGALLHAAEYATIKFSSPNAPGSPPPPFASPVRPKELTPEEAANILGMDPSRIFPVEPPRGFPRRQILKTGALETVTVRFSNGTSTGVILLFIRKPKFENIHYRPASPSSARVLQRRIRDLVLSGRAFVDGQFIGLTSRVDGLSCVELHTPEKSILALSIAGLAPIKELISYVPLP